MLMKDAIMPTLMQTLEQTPVLVHAGVSRGRSTQHGGAAWVLQLDPCTAA